MKEFEGKDHHPLSLDDLPSGWTSAFVGNVCSDIQSGFASGEHNAAGAGVPHLRPMNIDRQGRLDLSVVKSVAPGVDGRRLRPGDVLFNNTNSAILVGKTTTIRQVGDFAFSNHMTRLRTEDGVDPEYLGHQLHYLWMCGYFLHRCSKHVNQASVSSETLANTVPVAVAPTREQRRIVEALGSYLPQLEAAVSTLARVEQRLRAYRASVLRAAVGGRLVPTEAELARKEKREYEPASVLLDRILKERRHRWEQSELARLKKAGKPPKDDRWKAAYVAPPAPDTSELPQLPDGWCWTSLGQAFNVTVGATPSRGNSAYWNGNIPWVSSGEVSFCRITDTAEKITRLGFENSSTKMNPKGSVLLGMIGEGKTRGQVAILDVDACGNQNAAAIWVSQTAIPPEYVYYYLLGQYEATRRRGSGNNQPALNKSRVESIPLPLAPLPEQQRIVERLDADTTVISDIDASVQHSLSRASRVRHAILKWSFEGKLVDQDPADEPAEKLLARIRAERAAITTTKKPKNGKERLAG